jgi:hypothetical protein
VIVKRNNLGVEMKRAKHLTKADLNKKVKVHLGYFNETENGRLTDVYGEVGLDGDANIAVEIDGGLTLFLPPNNKVEVED